MMAGGWEFFGKFAVEYIVMNDNLIRLYRERFGAEPDSVDALPAAGSDRRYFRLRGATTVIGTDGTDVRENEAFIYLARVFANLGLPVPEVLAVSKDRYSYLQTDLGDISLYSLIERQGPQSEKVERNIGQVMRALPGFHYTAASVTDFNRCYPRAAMDMRAALWDLNYFKYCFLKPSGTEFDEDLLENALHQFASEVSANPDGTMMLRDMQSRNVMIHANAPYIIDFQGARAGQGLYDVASMLWQARAGLTDEQRMRFAGIYRRSAEGLTGKPIADFERKLLKMALFRTLQVLGAYGFRGYVEHRAMFLSSISQAVANLRRLIADNTLAPDYLTEVLRRMTSQPQFAEEPRAEGLTVRVTSFSYKRGIPDDLTGNGGGFVFDCRAIHNPGRYDQYKQLTGRDREVIEFLERESEMPTFMAECEAMVDRAVAKYMARGFTSLMVNFGCTGGRHRSVYGAEHLARHINEKFGVRVRLIHREQQIDETLPAKTEL